MADIIFKLELFKIFFPSSKLVPASLTPSGTEILISSKLHQKWTAGFEQRIRKWAGLNKDTPKGTIGGRRVLDKGISKGP